MFRTKYQHRCIAMSFEGVKSLTDPQFANECSIEGIVKRYGIIPLPEVRPLGADVSEIGDFGECMRKVQEGLDHFRSLPSEIRSRFGNDPRAYYDWVTDPANVAEAVKLGIMIERNSEPTVGERLDSIANLLNDRVTPSGGKTA